MTDANSSFSSLLQDAVSLQNGLTALSSDKNTLHEKIALLEAQLTQSQKENDQLKARYSKLNSDRDKELSALNSKLKNTQRTLLRALEDSESDKKEASDKSTQLSASIAKLSEKNAELASLLRESRAENLALRNEVKTQNKLLLSLEETTNALIKDMNFEKIKRSLRNAEARVGSLASDVSSSVLWRDDFEAQLSALHMTISAANPHKPSEVLQKLEINLLETPKSLSTSSAQTDIEELPVHPPYLPEDIESLTRLINSTIHRKSEIAAAVQTSQNYFLKELSQNIGVGIPRGMSALIDSEAKNTIDEIVALNNRLSDDLSIANQEILELKEIAIKPITRESSVQTDVSDISKAPPTQKKVTFTEEVPNIEEVNPNQQNRRRRSLLFPVNM